MFREEILRARIWHTRADAQKQAKSAPGLSDLVINKIIEFAGEPNNVHEQNPVQLKALNKKVNYYPYKQGGWNFWQPNKTGSYNTITFNNVLITF